MPYKNFDELPEELGKNLSENAKRSYVAAYNMAWEQYKRMDSSKREDTAHIVAWSLVEKIHDVSGKPD